MYQISQIRLFGWHDFKDSRFLIFVEEIEAEFIIH